MLPERSKARCVEPAVSEPARRLKSRGQQTKSACADYAFASTPAGIVGGLGRGPVTYAKTLRDPAHFTLWGEPQALLNCVVSVVEVGPREEMEGH
jgi:hypothetical protein